MAKYLYDAWGNCTISSETTNFALANANPIRYRGYYFDDDTGLYYCNARYYSPKWRRFIAPDDTAYLDPKSVNGLNLYCYCNNDPVNVGSTAPKKVNKFNILAANPELYKSTRGKQHKSVLSFRLPKSNHVTMTHHTTSLLENAFLGGFWGNISYTITTQWNESEAFYSYHNVGNDGASYGVGINLNSWYGRSVYLSSNIGIGNSTQLTPWFTYGSELSVLDGITVSAGIISGNTTHEISVNIGWGTIAFAYALACVPVPGTKVAASVILLCDLLI
jgi:RHS repeat-associated protein